jgi:hypothetical protein
MRARPGDQPASLLTAALRRDGLPVGNPARNPPELIMVFYNPTTVATTRTRNVRYWIAHDDNRKEWVAEVIVRRATGILYLIHRYPGDRPTRSVLYRHARRYGHLSPRPYQLAQACEGSIGSCVLALFWSFCEANQLDPITLLQRAYPDEPAYTDQDFVEIRSHADWEHTAYPARWDQAAIAGLLESLHEINYHSLASVVQETLDEEAV